MELRLSLLGEPGRVPFLGHFRVRHAGSSASWGVAGRQRGPTDPRPAFHLARAIEAAVLARWRELPAGADRFAGIHSGWEALRALQGVRPELSEGLEVVFLGVDEEGRAIAGSGLDSVWELDAGEPRRLAGPEHPLAGEAAWREAMPGVLQLPLGPARLVAVGVGEAGSSPDDPDWERRCGWRGV